MKINELVGFLNNIDEVELVIIYKNENNEVIREHFHNLQKFTSIDLKLREKYVDNYQLMINKDVNRGADKMILSIITHDFYYGDK